MNSPIQSTSKSVRPVFIVILSALAFSVARAEPAPWRQADFAANLYRRAAESAGESANVVISPYGVASLFSMLQTGARGDTARGMAFALQLGGVEPPEPNDVAATFHESRTALSRATNEWVALELTDSLWIKPGFAVNESFRARLRDAFDADARFTEMGAIGREAINGFVSEKTHGRIPELLPGGALDNPLTRMVAVDTVYLKAKWERAFEDGISNKTFHAPDGDVWTPFLHDERYAEILDAPDCAALRLPYRGTSLEMLILLPSPNNTLTEIEAKLGRPYLDRLAAHRWGGNARIALPKFKFDSEHDLKPILAPMGMAAAFSEGDADFGGIAPTIFLSTALQKAIIAVDAEGTEASAATAAFGIATSAMFHEEVPPRPFVADRPFLFLIRERRTGLILFLGRVIKPA